jgi:peptidoglycan hydrolase-like protein with peptidoglycan-binding domain
LYTVDSQPVVALTGALPAWRTLNSSSADGADIAQLEGAMVALGYDPTGTVKVDDSWGSGTTAMVKRWQAGLGLDQTGTVTLGSVVFIPHTATVSSTTVAVGDAVHDGDTVLELSGTVQRVVIDVPTELQADVTPSMRVDVAGTPGTVTRLRSADGTNGVTVQAVISPDKPLDAKAGSIVKVTISYAVATGQLVVPTESVVSRLDGTYALETVNGSGAHVFVPVQIVAVSGNRTAVTGEGVSESMKILAPA